MLIELPAALGTGRFLPAHGRVCTLPWLEALGWDTLISLRHVILRRDWPASGQIRYYLRWEGQWESIDLLID